MGFPGAASPHLELEDPRFPGVGGPLGLSLGRQVFGLTVLISRLDDNPYLTVL